MTKEQEKAMLEVMKILVDCMATDKQVEIVRARKEGNFKKVDLALQAYKLNKAWHMLDDISRD